MPVLDRFQSHRWPRVIDVSDLVPRGVNSKRWVGNTVKNLNRGLTGIRFHADGANHHISWGEA
jgi:hypothetical protein